MVAPGTPSPLNSTRPETSDAAETHCAAAYTNTMVSDGVSGAYISGKEVVVIRNGRATVVFG